MFKLLLILFVTLFLLSKSVNGQLVSPCPRLFRYEPQKETDRWYGVMTLLSDADTSGVWTRLIFDKPSMQLGNWFGEVVTTDNMEYLIKNPRHKLKANVPETIRFYIKYNPNESPPQLTGFRLNARTICPEGGTTPAAPIESGQLLTSSTLSTTARPIQPPIAVRPERPPEGDSDDFFQGDFAIFNRPLNNEPSLDTLACGTVIVPPRPLITHGQGTHEAEFPWHAALYHAKGIDLTYFCGASLISKKHLLTVAHCVTRRRSQLPIGSDDMVVYLGKYYLRRWSNPGIQNKNIEKIIVHADYNPHNYNNDIAILKLSSFVEITNYVRPICLWDGGSNLNNVVGKVGTVIGWGFDENGHVTEQLTKAHMPIVAQETCIYSFPDFYSRFTSSNTFCAGFQNGTSVCNGDSGGGLVLPLKSTNNNNKEPVWHIRGLVSISVALQNQLKCDSSHYVVFTDVAKYLDWIKNKIQH